MGTVVSIHVRGPRSEGAPVASLVGECLADLQWVDEVFSPYRPGSAVSRLRRGDLTVRQAAAIRPEIAEVIDLCQEATRRTGGAFSWLLPDDRGRLLIDPTGLVKGWAIARCVERLEILRGHAYCVNVGGDVAVGGVDGGVDGDRPWQIGLQDPRDPGRVAEVVAIRQGGVATSGTTARGAHLIDPSTGARPARRGSVSVVGPSILWADVWATALFVGAPALADAIFAATGQRLREMPFSKSVDFA